MIPVAKIIDEKYEIVGTLGAGGFGAVYVANQLQLDRKVAVKTLNTTLLLEAGGLARFEREAKAIGSLKHKNVVAIYGYGTFQQAPYMVMEFIEGTSIDKELRNSGKFEPMRALRLLRQILEGLSCAHAAGVIHRDLKPSNIMLTQDPDGKEVIKLIDFGLAKLMPGYGIPGQKLTETGYAIGTCHYMAPEQAMGSPVDGRSDIYAAGCILYEMLTGHPPFNADDNVAIMYQHLNNRPKAVTGELSAECPKAPISALVQNCMAKEPDQRYQTCSDALADIDAMLDGKYAKVKPLSAGQMRAIQPVGFSRNARLTVVGLGALALLFAAGNVLLTMNANDQDRHWTNEGDRNFVQDAMHGIPLEATPKIATTLAEIKARDDRSHYLTHAERFYTLVGLGYNDAIHGNNSQALAYATEAVKLKSDAIAHRYHHAPDVAIIFRECGETGAFLDILLDLSSRSDDPGVRFIARSMLIDYYIDTKQYKAAEACARENFQEDSKFASSRESMTKLALIKFLEHDLRAAEEYYEGLAIRRDPLGSIGVARCAILRGNYKRALDYAALAQKLYGRSKPEVLASSALLRCSALYCLNRDKDAQAEYEKFSKERQAEGESKKLLQLDQRIYVQASAKHKVGLADIGI